MNTLLKIDSLPTTLSLEGRAYQISIHAIIFPTHHMRPLIISYFSVSTNHHLLFPLVHLSSQATIRMRSLRPIQHPHPKPQTIMEQEWVFRAYYDNPRGFDCLRFCFFD